MVGLVLMWWPVLVWLVLWWWHVLGLFWIIFFSIIQLFRGICCTWKKQGWWWCGAVKGGLDFLTNFALENNLIQIVMVTSVWNTQKLVTFIWVAFTGRHREFTITLSNYRYQYSALKQKFNFFSIFDISEPYFWFRANKLNFHFFKYKSLIKLKQERFDTCFKDCATDQGWVNEIFFYCKFLLKKSFIRSNQTLLNNTLYDVIFVFLFCNKKLKVV